MRRHAFVTGASGYIGGHLVRELVNAGWAVTGLVRSRDHVGAVESLGARAAVGELGDPFLQVSDIAGDTVVFHLAAALTTWAQGVDGGRSMAENLVRLMARNRAQRLILVSSAAVHRPSHGATIVDESMPLGPHPSWSHYAQQKLAAETVVLRAKDEGRLSPTIVRPTRVLGPGDSRLVAWATRLATWVGGALAKDRAFRHPVVVVEELARGLVACADSTVTVGRTYYVSSAFEITRGNLLNAFIAAGMPAPELPLAKSLGLAAGRIAMAALEAPGRAIWPQSAGPRPVVVRALERRAGIPVGHDCVVSSGRAAADFGWRGTAEIELAIQQAVQWHLNRDARVLAGSLASGV